MKRRTFVKRVAVAAATTALARGASSQARSANERLTIGVVGCSRGLSVAREFAAAGANIAYVCDTDDARRERAKEVSGAPHAVTDLRRILDDPGVDAVIVAAPDHWHAPATLLACDAGKHVYVEKPCAHNIREGRLMIETARRTNRVVQVGSQSRSTSFIRTAMEKLRGGAIGEVLIAKAWNSQRRENIGRAEPGTPPAGFDYDLWVGPAPMRPFQQNCHHHTWHWWHDFGTGDAGNDGVHELDIARWGLGVDTHPARVSGYGGKLSFDDDQQFPDTQYVTFEYPGGDKPKLLVYEHRIWAPYAQEGYENGNAFYGTGGCMILGKGSGWRRYGPGNELIEAEEGRFSTIDHVADFMEAIQSGKRPNADIEIGHHAATLAHLANILARSGNDSFRFDPQSEGIPGNADADALVRRTYREGHWAVPAGG